VPSEHAGHHVSLRAYADRIVVVADNEVIAEHKRHFTRNISYFEPWHYVPLLDRKPGALRDGAPFVGWELPKAMEQIKDHYMRGCGGDREYVDLLLLALEHGIDVVETACDMALKQHTLRLPAIINLINQLLEPVIPPLGDTHAYPQLTLRPEAEPRAMRRCVLPERLWHERSHRPARGPQTAWHGGLRPGPAGRPHDAQPDDRVEDLDRRGNPGTPRAVHSISDAHCQIPPSQGLCHL
jgi:hypothetical protein